MSIHKINGNEAWQISDKIADKAFAHLIEPWKKQEQKLAKEAYDYVVESIGGERVVAALMAFKLVHSGDACAIEISDGANDQTVTYCGVNVMVGGRWDNILVVDGMKYERAVEINNEQTKLQVKRNSLQSTLEKQLTGKSAKAVIKAWPEAEGIINEFFGQQSDTSLVTPLETLLAKFLPMLPAPAPEAS